MYQPSKPGLSGGEAAGCRGVGKRELGLGHEPSQALCQLGSGGQGGFSYKRMRRQNWCWMKRQGQSTQRADDLSGEEEQGGQAQAGPTLPLEAESVSAQKHKIGSGRIQHKTPTTDQRCEHEATAPGAGRAQATSSHTATAEEEGGTAGGSGLGPVVCPPPDAHALGSELRMQTGPCALEEPSPGNLSPEADIGPEELQGTEIVTPLQGGDHRVQPVFRIVCTALGEPQEGSTDEPLRQ